MTPAEVAPGMTFGCWEILGPSCPEYRNGIRYVEAVCWCRVIHDVSTVSLATGKSHRCRSCEAGRRRSVLTNRGLDGVTLRNVNAERIARESKRAERLALIRQVAERRQVQS